MVALFRLASSTPRFDVSIDYCIKQNVNVNHTILCFRMAMATATNETGSKSTFASTSVQSPCAFLVTFDNVDACDHSNDCNCTQMSDIVFSHKVVYSTWGDAWAASLEQATEEPDDPEEASMLPYKMNGTVDYASMSAAARDGMKDFCGCGRWFNHRASLFPCVRTEGASAEFFARCCEKGIVRLGRCQFIEALWPPNPRPRAS